MDQQQQMQQAMHIWATMFPIIAIFWLVKIALYIIPTYRIAKRAGISPGLAFLAAIPLIGRLLALYVIAFSEWKVTPLEAGMFPPAFSPAYPTMEYGRAAYPPAPQPAYPPAPQPPVVASSEPPHTPSEPPSTL